MEKGLLLHALKAIEYRFIKASSGTKPGFGEFKIGSHTRCPNEIINHMYDLLAKTITKINEGHFNSPSPTILDFNSECSRFLIGIRELENAMAKNLIDVETSERLLQGPILDIATHVGQIAMLNGAFGSPIPKESYYDADMK